MGADFTMSKFPQFNFNDDRKEEIANALSSMKQEDFEELRDWYYFEDEDEDTIREDMLGAIEQAAGLSSRETGECFEYQKDGKKVLMSYTGGMSWGDDPTDAYGIFNKASHAEEVWNLANKFSHKDFGS